MSTPIDNNQMNSEASFISMIISDAQKQYNNKNYQAALAILSSLLTKNYQILYLRAKLYFELFEYNKSLKDCEECINLTTNKEKNIIDIYILTTKNYIKMFDIESAKNFLKQIKNNLSKESYQEIEKIIKTEEKILTENIKKYKQYPFYVSFMKTLFMKGFYINKITVKFNSEENRSTIATEEIHNNDVLLRIPKKALITLDDARKSPIGIYFTPVLEKKLNSPHHCILTSYILSELAKGDKSEWKFYFDFLPSSYDSFPIFYSDNELNYLKGTQFLELILKKKKEIKEDYVLLCKEIPHYSEYEFSLFCKIREVVSSRIFGVTIGGKKNDIIAPYADMLNHRRPRQTHWNYEDSINCFVVKAIDNISKGCEVFDSYGIKCNSRFLLNYGFTIEKNEDNEFKIILILSEVSPFYQKKVEFLGAKNVVKKFSLVCDISDLKVIQFFSYLRFILFDEECANYSKIDMAIPYKIQNEIVLFIKIRELMDIYLSKYPTSLKDDEEYLKNNRNKMSFNEYNCYIIRIGEKRILHYFIEMSETCLELLQTDKNEVKNIIQDIISSPSTSKHSKLLKYKSYLTVVLPLLLVD